MDNAAARSFYNELGYQEGANVQGMYGGRVDGVKMEKWLRTGQSAEQWKLSIAATNLDNSCRQGTVQS
jgi:hypothetical protein